MITFSFRELHKWTGIFEKKTTLISVDHLCICLNLNNDCHPAAIKSQKSKLSHETNKTHNDSLVVDERSWGRNVKYKAAPIPVKFCRLLNKKIFSDHFISFKTGSTLT